MLMKESCSWELVAESGVSSDRGTSGMRSAASVSVGCEVPALTAAAVALDARRSLKALIGLLKDMDFW
jgi:hypothetical protein